MKRAATTLISTTVLAACNHAVPVPALDIAETTFRYQISHSDAAQANPALTACLGFDNARLETRNPPPELISRLRYVRASAKPWTECSWLSGKVVDRLSGEQAIIFTVGVPKCSGDSSCQIDGGYQLGNLGSSRETFFLEKRGAEWIVVKNMLRTIA
ncbi:MAG: hypothetical protein JOY77_00930 [Alphaproteobacteria bacterium]|nr:hypothetical protein [Alphaproteobacteria bacterium]MBV9061477.1 hypothetical protein [Alphaproteobacteria bacterium]